MKNYRLRVWAALLLVCAMAGSALALDAEREASALSEGILAGRALAPMSAPAEEKTYENAYQVQALTVAKLMKGRPDAVAGYKGALTAPAQLAKFNADRPASAPLFKSGLVVVSDPAKPFVLKSFPGMMLETELAFKTANAITEPLKDEASLKELIDGVYPAIEVPQLYFEDMSKVSVADIIASCIGSRLFIVGLPSPVSAIEPDSVSVTLSRGGETVNEGKATDALGGQWKALLWLVNDTLAHGYKIEAGQYLLTGACGNMIPAKPGEYAATFSFGSILFSVQ